MACPDAVATLNLRDDKLRVAADMERGDAKAAGALERREQSGVLGDVVGRSPEVEAMLLACCARNLEHNATPGFAGVAAGRAVNGGDGVPPGHDGAENCSGS